MAKHRPLLLQYLENISRDALREYQAIIRDYVRGKQGIYALYRKDRLYYVGLASNLRVRLGQHLKDKHGESWDRFSVYLTDGGDHLRELESLILRIVKPKGNSQTGRFARSENLKTRLGRDVRNHLRQKASLLLGHELRTRAAANRRKRSAADGETLPLAGTVDRAMTIRATYKGYVYMARLRRNGTIKLDGKVYRSPSAAALAVKKRAANGWRFWRYRDKSGEWVPLLNLRS